MRGNTEPDGTFAAAGLVPVFRPGYPEPMNPAPACSHLDQ
jgi:hypothetical protein